MPPESETPSDLDERREGDRPAGRHEAKAVPREPLPPPFQPAKVESIQAAIEKVTAIMGDLQGVLGEMELVLEYLEDAERQQIADEREIQDLQQRLNLMHRRADRHPHSRPPQRQPEPPADEAD
jgi:hypothetical protein